MLDDRVGIGVGGVLHFLQYSLEITLFEIIRSKFVKLVGIHMYPFYFLLPVLLLFIEYFSNSAEVRDAVTKLFPRILRIISVASGM